MYRQSEKNLLSSNISSTCHRNMVNLTCCFLPMSVPFSCWETWDSTAVYVGIWSVTAIFHPAGRLWCISASLMDPFCDKLYCKNLQYYMTLTYVVCDVVITCQCGATWLSAITLLAQKYGSDSKTAARNILLKHLFYCSPSAHLQ